MHSLRFTPIFFVRNFCVRFSGSLRGNYRGWELKKRLQGFWINPIFYRPVVSNPLAVRLALNRFQLSSISFSVICGSAFSIPSGKRLFSINLASRINSSSRTQSTSESDKFLCMISPFIPGQLSHIFLEISADKNERIGMWVAMRSKKLFIGWCFYYIYESRRLQSHIFLKKLSKNVKCFLNVTKMVIFRNVQKMWIL